MHSISTIQHCAERNADEIQRRATAYDTCRKNVALGNADPIQQQADTTKNELREVVGSLMEVVARPPLTTWGQTFKYTENDLITLNSRA